MLLDTKPISSGAEIRNLYRLRPAIEERHRQLKCFSGIDEFSSRAFSLVVNQVTFVLLTYSLLQWYLLRTQRKPPLNPKNSNAHPGVAAARLLGHRYLLSKPRGLSRPPRIPGNGAHSF